jgi:hypothetical protein
VDSSAGGAFNPRVLRDILTLFGFLAVAILVYRYHRAVLDALKRFDARNVKRIEEQARARVDPLAHFRETMAIAGEQVEEIQEVRAMDTRLGTPTVHYVFEGEHFLTRDDAERVRAAKIGSIARNYYVDLPRALAERKAPETVRGATSSPPPKPAPHPSNQGSNVVPFRRTPGGDTIH